MRIEIARLNIMSTPPRQSPVVKAPENGGGVVQGTITNGFPTRPVAMETYVITVTTKGTIINGINKIGFKTIGVPKITGSLMLNTLDQIDIRPRFFKCFERARQTNKIARANAIPEPPTANQIAING